MTPPDDDAQVDIDAIIAQLEQEMAEDRARGEGAMEHEEEPDEAPLIPRLWPIVTQALDEYDWRYDVLDGPLALARVRGTAANYDVFLSADEATEIVRCSVLMPVRIPPARHGAVCELLNRVNYVEVGLGAFDIDPSDGQPRWRQSMDVEGGLLGTAMVHNMVSAGLGYCDRVWGRLMAVAFAGVDPGDAAEASP